MLNVEQWEKYLAIRLRNEMFHQYILILEPVDESVDQSTYERSTLFDNKSDLADREDRLEDSITLQSANTAESAPPVSVAEDFITQETEDVEESAPPQHDQESEEEEPEAVEGT